MKMKEKLLLIIDTTDKICLVGLQHGNIFEVKKWSWQEDTGTEVLANIEKILKKRSKTLENIDEIIVNRGPGSYTGTRVGITLANTLGWSLNKPVYGLENSRYQKSVDNANFFSVIAERSPKCFVTPIYSE